MSRDRRPESSASIRPLTTSGRGGTPGKRTLTQGLVQRKGRSAPSLNTSQTSQTSPVEVAEAGVANASAPLPHLEQIQPLFGGHDVSHVRANVGGEAAMASTALGAEAFATGDRVAFAEPPSLHTAAHEAAHVVQQRSGVQLKDSIGHEGDAYELHADAVADTVVRGESAESLLGSAPGRTAEAEGL